MDELKEACNYKFTTNTIGSNKPQTQESRDARRRAVAMHKCLYCFEDIDKTRHNWKCRLFHKECACLIVDLNLD